MARWLLAAVHLLALGIGLGAVWGRGRALRGPLDPAGLGRVFHADAWWGIAAVLWIATGVPRAFGGLEKGTAYYLGNHIFLTKRLEVWPMISLIKWRIRMGRGLPVDTGAARALARTSFAQAALVILMVFAATAMARGYGAAP